MGCAGKLRPRSRRGASLVEFALCLPIFFLITMGTVELCRLIYLRQSLKITAYECARLGIIPGMSKTTLECQCDLLLRKRKIKGYSFTCEPDDPKQLALGDIFTVRIDIPIEQNALIGRWFIRDQVFSESVHLMAEYDSQGESQ